MLLIFALGMKEESVLLSPRGSLNKEIEIILVNKETQRPVFQLQ